MIQADSHLSELIDEKYAEKFLSHRSPTFFRGTHKIEIPFMLVPFAVWHASL